MKPNPKLNDFLSLYDESLQELVWQLRHFIFSLVPETNELIWDNYNALAIAYSKSKELKDAFCHISVYSEHVNFGFNRGSELTSKVKIDLQGSGKFIRHLKVKDFESFNCPEMKSLVLEAIGISESRNTDLNSNKIKAQSIVMSISTKKRRPRKI